TVVYRHSVVPGGVHSAADVLAAVRRDPVVAEHYASVNIQALRVEKLAGSRSAYVSYRLGDRVYLTSRPVRLQASEPILSDGHTMIRARCGNCISFEERQPQAAANQEPAPEEMDLFIGPDAPTDDAGAVAWQSPPGGEGSAAAFYPIDTTR